MKLPTRRCQCQYRLKIPHCTGRKFLTLVISSPHLRSAPAGRGSLHSSVGRAVCRRVPRRAEPATAAEVPPNADRAVERDIHQRARVEAVGPPEGRIFAAGVLVEAGGCRLEPLGSTKSKSGQAALQRGKRASFRRYAIIRI